MIGLLSYLPTTAYFPQAFFILAFLSAFYVNRKSLIEQVFSFVEDSTHPINWNFLIIVLILIFSTINRVLHWQQLEGMGEAFPFYVLLVASYVVSISFREQDAKVLIALIGLEAIAVIVQFQMGLNSFDPALIKESTGGDLLYNNRAFGFSANSSHIALKLLMGLLLLEYFSLKAWGWRIAQGILLVAVIYTFNRSVMLVLLLFYGLLVIQWLLKKKYTRDELVVGMMAVLTSVFGAVIVLVVKWRVVWAQLFRNQESVSLTGRPYIWKDFWEFVVAHPFWGNGSVKLWLDNYHAHNSYLEVLATNGVMIFLLYILLIYRNIHSKNWVYIVPVLVVGVTQYAFFWGISLVDILLGVLLFQLPKAKRITVLPS